VDSTQDWDRFEATIVRRCKLPLVGRNEWKRHSDRFLNDDRRGKVNGVESSNRMGQNKLFCLTEDRPYRFDKLPKRAILFHAGGNRLIIRSGDFALSVPVSQG
jgi:hypothetical protein